jgi:hypothetical protein
LPNKGQKTITVSGKNLKELERRYLVEKNNKPNLSFAAFVSDSALMELERRRILSEAQFISLIGIQENVIYLKDYRKSERFIEVYLKNKKLKCICRQQSDCIHVGFALALPEVRRTLNQ